jgi:Eukaryotic-type carbonic anhydrase
MGTPARLPSDCERLYTLIRSPSVSPNFCCPQPGTCTLDDLTFALSDRNVQTSFPAKGCEAPTMLIPGEIGLAWKVAQIHVHLGSEHSLNGTKYVAEIHVVHKAVGRGSGDVSSQQSVLGAFLEVSDSTRTGGFVDGLLRRWEAEAKAVSAACAPMGKNVPTIAKASSDNIPQLRQKSTTRRFDPYHSLLSKNYSLYTYRGSLTTPPCSESVRWNVLAEPVPVSATDLDRLRELILRYVHPATCEPASIASLSQGRPGTTSRPLSPLNGRHVARFCSVA